MPDCAEAQPADAGRPTGAAHDGTSLRGIFVGVSLRIGAMACVAVLNALVKWCSERGVPLFEIVFFRNAFAFVPLVIYMSRVTGFGVLRTRRPLGHLTRSAIGLTSMCSGFAAVQRLPLTEAVAFQFTAPLFMTALAAPFLGEAVGRHRWGAVLVGFLGVLIMLRPQPGHMNLTGAGLALLAAVTMGMAGIAVREMGRTEAGAGIVFYFTLAGTLLGLASLPFGWKAPDPATVALLIVCGLVGGLGQLLLTEALRVAPVGVVAPFDYSQLVWAGLIAFVVWGEVPKLGTVLGAAIVAASGVYILLRETRRFRSART
jgi:drug/metabolite transporter (DMT)-like permease